MVDASDPAAVVFAVAGLDPTTSPASSVSFDGRATSQAVTLADGEFTASLVGTTGDVTAVLTVGDGTNQATAQASFTLADDEPGDGMETADGIAFTRYEAESATLIGGPDLVTTAEDDRGQRGGAFVDFDGTSDQTIEWTVEVDEAGTYRVDVLYALGQGKTARPMALTVDGQPAGTLGFPANSNAAEDEWGPATMTLALGGGDAHHRGDGRTTSRPRARRRSTPSSRRGPTTSSRSGPTAPAPRRSTTSTCAPRPATRTRRTRATGRSRTAGSSRSRTRARARSRSARRSSAGPSSSPPGALDGLVIGAGGPVQVEVLSTPTRSIRPRATGRTAWSRGRSGS